MTQFFRDKHSKNKTVPEKTGRLVTLNLPHVKLLSTLNSVAASADAEPMDFSPGW
jgi:hypothetical protein